MGALRPVMLDNEPQGVRVGGFRNANRLGRHHEPALGVVLREAHGQQSSVG